MRSVSYTHLDVYKRQTSQDTFLLVVNSVKDWIWENFKWLFSGYGLVAVVVCLYACFSKFGNTIIGGKDAKPILLSLIHILCLCQRHPDCVFDPAVLQHPF